ncbi:hypothetical protein BCAH1134_C0055 (plasmid) [Bacillus cereus AH1134]|nr:hypothetical protein BCAH1134_C0055 [Bacillus cereus AH1134]
MFLLDESRYIKPSNLVRHTNFYGLPNLSLIQVVEDGYGCSSLVNK